jgi:hypothetical protein
MDSRIIDMSFNPVFMKRVLHQDVPLTLESLKVRPFAFSSTRMSEPFLTQSFLPLQSVDSRLAASLSKVFEFAEAKQAMQSADGLVRSLRFPSLVSSTDERTLKAYLLFQT